ncbi:MAG: hypothetical protein ABI718_04005 [Acidobacteriota bacterium]
MKMLWKNWTGTRLAGVTAALLAAACASPDAAFQGGGAEGKATSRLTAGASTLSVGFNQADSIPATPLKIQGTGPSGRRRPTHPYTPAYPVAQTVASQPPQIMMERPRYLDPTPIDGLETLITRISDAGVFGGSQRIYRHFYSKRQPWNSDGSRLLLAFENNAYLLDGKTYRLIDTFTPWSDPIWSNKDPDILYGVASSPGGLVEYRVSTRTFRIVQSFPEWADTSIGVGEGNLSDDDRYVALVGVSKSGVDVLVYNVGDEKIVSRKAFPGPITLGQDLDWASVSPSGRFVVVCLNGKVKAHDVYDSQTMTFLRRLTFGSASHADMGYDSDGNEVLVTQNGSNAISSIRLADGVSRQELPANLMASNQHISCRNTLRPGWCYVSTFAYENGFEKFMYREIFSLKLDGSGTVERFAQRFSAEFPVADLEYARESQAVPNRTGLQVLFASDWGDATSNAEIDDYVAGVQFKE